MARSKTKITYGKDDQDFTFFLEHKDLAELTKVDRSFYKEAFARFATRIRQDIENRANYDRNEGNANAGIMNTLNIMRDQF